MKILSHMDFGLANPRADRTVYQNAFRRFEQRKSLDTCVPCSSLFEDTSGPENSHHHLCSLVQILLSNGQSGSASACKVICGCQDMVLPVRLLDEVDNLRPVKGDHGLGQTSVARSLDIKLSRKCWPKRRVVHGALSHLSQSRTFAILVAGLPAQKDAGQL